MDRVRAPIPAIIAALVLAGCGAGGGGDDQGWDRIRLEFEPDSVTAAPAGALLIGGHTGTGEDTKPAYAVRIEGRVAPRTVVPSTPYGQLASLVAVGAADRAYALGVARGGAHGNPRWTVWVANGRGDPLIEHEQVFWVFGGHESGTMVAQVATPRGPVVVGSWAGAVGMDVALWLGDPDGARYARRESAGTELASTSTRQYEAHGATAAGDLTVIAGEQLALDRELLRQPVVWLWEGADRPVRRVELPAPEGRADSAACGAGRCWVAGVAEGRAALWQVWPGPVQRVELAELPVDREATAYVLVRGSEPMVLTTAGGRARRVGVSGDGPPGRVIGAAGAADGEQFVIVTGDSGRELWRVG